MTQSDTISLRVLAILTEVLQVPSDGEWSLRLDSRLLGVLPELDSMAVVAILTQIEEEFGIEINDEDVSAALFETVGTLAEFVSEQTRQPKR